VVAPTEKSAVPGSGTCVEHPSVGTAGPWWVQEPQQEQLGCLPGPCGDEDWIARVDGAPHSQVWTLSTLHIGDCEIVPAATYNVYTCDPVVMDFCSEPLLVATQSLPFVAPSARGGYGDVVGPVEGIPPDLAFTAPDGFVNTVDVLGYLLTKQNYGTPNNPQAHPTWIDLNGIGSGNPPNYILNISDLTQILFGLLGHPWTRDPGNMDPGECP